jgi:hypothetical protein
MTLCPFLGEPSVEKLLPPPDPEEECRNALIETEESPEPTSVFGLCVFAAFFFSALRSSGPFPLPLFTKYVE